MSDVLRAALIEKAKRERARRQGAQATDKPEADMSLMGRLKDNVIGVDDGVNSFGENAAAALNIAGESLTMGLVGDEASAGLDAAMGRGPYEDRLQVRRQQEAGFRERNPKTALAAEIAPALIPGAGAAQALKGVSKLGRAGAGALVGAASGGTYGFMEGEGDISNRVQGGTAGAVLGGLIGGAAPKVMDSLSKLPKRLSGTFRRSQERPTLENLKATKSAAYRAVDESGETFTGEEVTGLYDAVRNAFDDGTYVEGSDTASDAVLRILERQQGQPLTLSKLDTIRKNIWKRYGSAKDQPRLLDAVRAIDDLIDQKSGASDLMGAARAANSRYAKTQMLHDAFQKASDQTASSGSGGNIVNKYRQAVTAIINNPKKAKFFSVDEIDLMRGFVEGSTSENVRRLIGKLSPSGNGLMMALHVVGGVSSNGMTVPLMAVGAGAKGSADRAAMRGAETLQDVVSGFKPVPDVPRLTSAQGGAVSGSAALAGSEASRLLERQRQVQ